MYTNYGLLFDSVNYSVLPIINFVWAWLSSENDSEKEPTGGVARARTKPFVHHQYHYTVNLYTRFLFIGRETILRDDYLPRNTQQNVIFRDRISFVSTWQDMKVTYNKKKKNAFEIQVLVRFGFKSDTRINRCDRSVFRKLLVIFIDRHCIGDY